MLLLNNISMSSVNLEVSLTQEQSALLSAINKGYNVIIQGRAGSGKSTVLKALRQSCKNDDDVFFTAMTGMAACVLGDNARTLHSFAGICDFRSIPKLSIEDCVDRCIFQGHARMRKARLLVIDECSMLSARLFTILDSLARRARGSNDAFGGLQVVLCGDIYQQHPCADEPDFHVKSSKRSGNFKWFFEAERFKGIVGRNWHESLNNWRFFELKEPLRHPANATDAALKSFATIAAAFARGDLRHGWIPVIDELKKPKLWPEGVLPTILYAARELVDAENSKHLAKLEGVLSEEYTARDTGDFVDSGLTLTNLPTSLALKVGVPVILLKNYMRYGLCNGSQGFVESLVPVSTIRRAGIPLLGELPRDVEKKLPFVIFYSGQRFAVGIETATTEESPGKVSGTRAMLPLIVSYSITIARSQGLTLDYVILDCERIAHASLLGVGLTRIRNPCWLELRNFVPNAVDLPEKDTLARFKSDYFPTNEARSKKQRLYEGTPNKKLRS